MDIVITVLVFFSIIIIHEFGHYITARIFKMNVDDAYNILSDLGYKEDEVMDVYAKLMFDLSDGNWIEITCNKGKIIVY